MPRFPSPSDRSSSRAIARSRSAAPRLETLEGRTLLSITYPAIGLAPVATHRVVAHAAPTAPNANLITNGGFETGDFTGWTVLTRSTGGLGTPFQPWTVSGPGAGSGFSLVPTMPRSGAFDAWNGFDGAGPMQFSMTQDVTLPSGVSTHLTWSDRVQWNFSVAHTATLPRTYQVEVLDPASGKLLATLFNFSTGASPNTPATDTGWQTHAAVLSTFAGRKVRLEWLETIPESFTGPGQIEFDDIAVNIVNTAPTISSLSVGPQGGVPAPSGSTVIASGSFSDVDTHDVHTAVINWGDGTPVAPLVVTESGGTGLFLGHHVYSQGGLYAVTVTVSDNHGGSTTRNTQVAVTGASVRDGVLEIIGTPGNDVVSVHRDGEGGLLVQAGFLPHGSATFPGSAVKIIDVSLYGGGDDAVISDRVVTPAILDGGAGGDHLQGGGGPNILLGGPGNDRLDGGLGRNLIVGGTGVDRLHGHGPNDILIDGPTAVGSDPASIRALFAELASNAPLPGLGLGSLVQSGKAGSRPAGRK